MSKQSKRARFYASERRFRAAVRGDVPPPAWWPLRWVIKRLRDRDTARALFDGHIGQMSGAPVYDESLPATIINVSTGEIERGEMLGFRIFGPRPLPTTPALDCATNPPKE